MSWLIVSEQKPERDQVVRVKTPTGERTATYMPTCYPDELYKNLGAKWVFEDLQSPFKEKITHWRHISTS